VAAISLLESTTAESFGILQSATDSNVAAISLLESTTAESFGILQSATDSNVAAISLLESTTAESFGILQSATDSNVAAISLLEASGETITYLQGVTASNATITTDVVAVINDMINIAINNEVSAFPAALHTYLSGRTMLGDM
jgi:hypothetical protein